MRAKLENYSLLCRTTFSNLQKLLFLIVCETGFNVSGKTPTLLSTRLQQVVRQIAGFTVA